MLSVVFITHDSATAACSQTHDDASEHALCYHARSSPSRQSSPALTRTSVPAATTPALIANITPVSQLVSLPPSPVLPCTSTLACCHHARSHRQHYPVCQLLLAATTLAVIVSITPYANSCLLPPRPQSSSALPRMPTLACCHHARSHR